MGGVVNSVKNVANSTVKVLTNPGKANLGDFARAGGALSVVGAPMAVLGDMALGGKGSGGNSAPTVGGAQDPLQILTSSGGAPLLTNIALGADVGTTLMGYFGASGNYNNWFQNLNEADQSAVRGLHDQLTQIQSNTDLRNQAVQKLTTDFPNIMAQKIPQYSAIADDATKQMMDQALKQISASQAATGGFSSGATAQATADAGAKIGMQKLQYGTGLALQDFNQQYSQATALQSFQQKMLGQGATQGFNAIQNQLQRNTGIASQQANLQYQTDAANNASNNAALGAIGQLGGTIIGGMMGGPPGAVVGGQLGGVVAPRLNTSTGPMNSEGIYNG